MLSLLRPLWRGLAPQAHLPLNFARGQQPTHEREIAPILSTPHSQRSVRSSPPSLQTGTDQHRGNCLMIFALMLKYLHKNTGLKGTIAAIIPFNPGN